MATQDEPPDPDDAALAALYTADEAALRRVLLRTQAFRWGLVGCVLMLVAAPLVLTSVFMNMDSSGSGHLIGLVGMFSGFLGVGCLIGSVAALFDAWRAGR